MKTQITSSTVSVEHLPMNAVMQQFKTEVQFGSPKDKCKGLGICRVTMISPSVSIESKSINRAIAFASLTFDKQLKFAFQKDALSASALETYVQGGKFVLLDEYECNPTLSKRLGLDAMVIPAGVYQVEETELFLTVTFATING